MTKYVSLFTYRQPLIISLIELKARQFPSHQLISQNIPQCFILPIKQIFLKEHIIKDQNVLFVLLYYLRLNSIHNCRSLLISWYSF